MFNLGADTDKKLYVIKPIADIARKLAPTIYPEIPVSVGIGTHAGH